MIARAILKRKAGRIIIAAHDMAVEVPMPVAAFERAAGVGRAFQAIVNDPAVAAADFAVDVQAEMIWRGRPVINPAVRNIHGKARGVELRLGKALARQPRQITRPVRRVPRQVPRHNLVLPLIQLFRLEPGQNGNHVRLRGDAGQIRRRKPADHIQIMQSRVLPLERLQLQPVQHWQRLRVGLRIGHHLHGKPFRADLARVAPGVHRPGRRMNFVIVQISTFPLDVRRLGGQRLHPRNRPSVAIDQISILRDVTDNLRAGAEKGFPPGGLHRAGKMNQVHPFAGERRRRFAQRLGFWQRSVQPGGIELDDIILVPHFHQAGQRGQGGRVNVIKLKASVIGNQARSPGRELAGQGGIAYLDFVPRRGGHGGGGGRGWNLGAGKRRGRQPPKQHADCAKLDNNGLS